MRIDDSLKEAENLLNEALLASRDMLDMIGEAVHSSRLKLCSTRVSSCHKKSVTEIHFEHSDTQKLL